MVSYSVETARYVLGDKSKDPRLDKIRTAVDAVPDGLTRSEVSALFGRHLNRVVLNDLLSRLVTDKGYEHRTQTTDGRPADVYLRIAKDAK